MSCCSKYLSRALIAAALLVAPAASAADVHDYIRWNRHGQLDYRRLLQRYEPVTSFGFAGESYGYPYAASGGMLWPSYYWPGGYYFLPGAPGPVYRGYAAVVHRY